jgi:hypothetical protein
MLAIAAETAAQCSTTTRRLMQLPMLLLDVPIPSRWSFPAGSTMQIAVCFSDTSSPT